MTYFGVPNSTQLTQHFRFFFASFVFFFFLSLVALDCKLFDFFLYMYWLCIFRLLTNLSNLLCNIRVSWRKLNWIELTWCSKWKFKKQHQQQQKRKKKKRKGLVIKSTRLGNLEIVLARIIRSKPGRYAQDHEYDTATSACIHFYGNEPITELYNWLSANFGLLKTIATINAKTQFSL